LNFVLCFLCFLLFSTLWEGESSMRMSTDKLLRRLWLVGTCLLLCGPGYGDKAGAEGAEFHGIKAGRVLFLGNSITLHGPKPDIGWEGNWGMAASSLDRDYVHLVLRAIAEATGKEPQSLVANIADFERQSDRFDVEARLAKELALKPELVIVAIGENVPALDSGEARAAFQEQTAKLLKRLKENGQPTIVVRSCFWPDPAKDAALRQACAQVGGIFVDIGPLGGDPANAARAERDYAHAGVAAHPGDRGMKAIADAILAALAAESPRQTSPGAPPAGSG
jgi:hypothetical protein